MSDSDNVKSAIDAVTGLVKEVPVYQDLLQPSIREIGKGLHTLTKAVSIALSPVSILVWGYEEISNFVTTKVAEKLKHTPIENIIPPRPNIGGPALEALRYIGHEVVLTDLYANLLATAMDKTTARNSHPSFVELIRQMTADEAKIMKLFLNRNAYPVVSVRAEIKGSSVGYDHTILINDLGDDANCELPDMSPYYLDNLRRLGLLDILAVYGLHDEIEYSKLEESEETKKTISDMSLNTEFEPRIIRGGVKISPLGSLFLEACVKLKV
ncbi:DUF4393 domain-containing protein [Paenalcaligenes niemegkensis]|uniref:DUF4393 domain-containing protein n=1 Tax=Paenalcaligenes niemegkensis TaxID=2895469 RepID=UPI001EE82A4F|nr:DUF4393 domain-containing protein [Paenalcaligenes niemegkensis]MCQ9616419.1 DUF4393 domain-containing protein [Paenalcaligenes niemegkensis]